ncbi:apolipoprotein d [Stylonychia lemnae]|uniref:Apolipoprotein d n=1 Tax=Stylonychia lemnae TaxID=5949 RepID=A0A077ZPY9_STYLE|nr:apolipoprotein d [Stylonychia lemnae]|eukprot:CDW71968.1 apolipoprotein d [Stylonychia lemnae]
MRRHILGTLLIAILLINSVQSRWFWGKCPQFGLEESFNLTKYQGQWFEQARDKATFYEAHDCVHGRYKVDAKGMLRISNVQYDLTKKEHSLSEGRAICAGALCYSKFHNVMDIFGDYQVLSTDYNKYALVYTCTNFLDAFSQDYVWILTRDAVVEKEYLQGLHDTLWDKHPEYDAKNFYYTRQGGLCDYTV